MNPGGRDNELARYRQAFKGRAVARMLPPESSTASKPKRRDTFLAPMEEVVPWAALCEVSR